jgi:hypothetical protein
MEVVERVMWSEKVFKSPYKKDLVRFAVNKLRKNEGFFK